MTLTNGLPPQDLEAERGVLGSCLLANDAIDEVLPLLNEADFYADANRLIWAAVRRMHDGGAGGIDLLTVRHELEAKGDLEQAGGVPALKRCLEEVPHALHASYYAEIVQQKSDLRRIMEVCRDTLAACDCAEEPEEIIARAEGDLHRILESRLRGDVVPFRDAKAELQAWLDSPHVDRAPTGFPDLDDKLSGGLAVGSLNVLAARPSMGKTALGCNLVVNQAGQGTPCVIFTLEQCRLEVTQRLISIVTRIPLGDITTKNLTPFQRDKIAELREYPIHIKDLSGQTAASIAATLRPMVRRGDAGVALIDYLQLLTPENSNSPREQQVAAMSRSLKCAARDLSIPIVLLAQLNRQLESRPNKKPLLSDLRESGAVEQDADVVLFLHRPQFFDASADEHEATLVVSKNRQGRTGEVPLYWSPEIVTFHSAAKPHQVNGSLT